MYASSLVFFERAPQRRGARFPRPRDTRASLPIEIGSCASKHLIGGYQLGLAGVDLVTAASHLFAPGGFCIGIRRAIELLQQRPEQPLLIALRRRLLESPRPRQAMQYALPQSDGLSVTIR